MIGQLQHGIVTVFSFTPSVRIDTIREGQDLGPRALPYDEPPLLEADFARHLLVTSGRIRYPAVLYWPDGRDLAAADAIATFTAAARNVVRTVFGAAGGNRIRRS